MFSRLLRIYVLFLCLGLSSISRSHLLFFTILLHRRKRRRRARGAQPWFDRFQPQSLVLFLHFSAPLSQTSLLFRLPVSSPVLFLVPSSMCHLSAKAIWLCLSISMSFSPFASLLPFLFLPTIFPLLLQFYSSKLSILNIQIYLSIFYIYDNFGLL